MNPRPEQHPTVEKIRRLLRIDRMHPLARKVFAGLVGGTILLVGVIMIVAPGPAVVVIPLGLMILGSEFIWAQRMSEKLVRQWHRLKTWWRRRRAERAGPPGACG